ncbi:GntR family transcriptional regulator [Rhodococcus koreensis]|uniref:GntR family transcriptional regulator n=1 Tax=Rhodococcus koreensis TaxID=99653 RepID=UPI0019823D2D|nr:GntR family transcriptional regulator [Rhodococcus koreensis]QSE86098.1 GntR family transcriptional regulator [Rhodococcus koreensis]
MDVAPVDQREPRRRSGKRTQLPDQVKAYVRELITSGQVRPGEFLRIERIAEALGTSQSPVREGLLSLANEGLLNFLPRRGFVVAPITAEDINDLYWAQAQVAGELAARAAAKITDEQLDVLAANVKQYAQAVKSGDWEAIPEIGLEFHNELHRAAQAHKLVMLFDHITSNLPNRYYSAGNPKHTGTEHPALLKALRNRDAETARQLMFDHILGQGHRLVEILAERGLWADSAQLEEEV